MNKKGQEAVYVIIAMIVIVGIVSVMFVGNFGAKAEPEELAERVYHVESVESSTETIIGDNTFTMGYNSTDPNFNEKVAEAEADRIRTIGISQGISIVIVALGVGITMIIVAVRTTRKK